MTYQNDAYAGGMCFDIAGAASGNICLAVLSYRPFSFLLGTALEAFPMLSVETYARTSSVEKA